GESRAFPDVNALAGKKIAVPGGTSSADFARALSTAKGFQLVEYPDFALQQQALMTRQVDAAIADLPTWAVYDRERPGQIDMLDKFDTDDRYAYAVRKGSDPRLIQAINDVLRDARTNGTYAAVHSKWLGAGA
nr:transporter substrate-binding domain-containing protein [Longispora sp. (in: high G+C Gram-positive bacteria)]